MNRNLKTIFKLTQTIILSLVLTLFSAINVFAIEDGIYLVPTTTYYVNPDTGEVDDVGSGNIALGESMTRSALGEKALLEVQNGKYYVTFRIQLISNISDVKIYTQSTKGGSYSKVATTIKAENYSSDFADYRFEVKNLNTYISIEFYVAPMGRNVKFYASFDANKAVAGSGDFVTTIKIEKETTTAPVTNTQTNDSSQNTNSSSSNTSTQQSSSSTQQSDTSTQQSNTTTNSSTSNASTEVTQAQTASNSVTSQTQNTKQATTPQNDTTEQNTTYNSEEAEENAEENLEEKTTDEEATEDKSDEDTVATFNQNGSEKTSGVKTSMLKTGSLGIITSFIVILAILIYIIVKFGKK